MRKKRFYIWLYSGLGLLAGLLLILNGAQLRWAGIFTEVSALPYEPIGYGLRKLSLMGGAWDILAWVLYLGLGLLPVLPLLRRLAAHRNPGSSWMALPASGMVFLTIYYMVNPGLLALGRNLLLTGTAHSLFAAWLTLWEIERLEQSGQNRRLQSLKWLLAALDGALVIAAFGSAPADFLEAVQAAAKANTALTPADLALTNGFLLGKTLVEGLPLLLDLLLVHRVLMLVDAAGENPFGESAAQAASLLADTAKKVVLAQVLAQMAFHLAQLAASDQLCSTSVSVNLPLFSILLGGAAMVLARWMTQGRELREENDSFI